MLKAWQVAVLIVLGVAMWGLVTYRIGANPTAVLAPKNIPLMILTAPIAGFVSVWLCKFVGRLAPEQILPGVAVVGAAAMLLDGAALRWFPGLYGSDERALRLGAADLLWGYGVGFAAALVWRWVALARASRASGPGSSTRSAA